MSHEKKNWKKRTKILAWLLLLIPSLALLLFPLMEIFKESILINDWIHDPFIKDCFAINAKFSNWEFLPGCLLLLVGGYLLIQISRAKFNYIPSLFFTVAFSLFLTLTLIVPKIEMYVQGPEVRFFKSLKNQKCYAETVSYKSFAQLFYSEKKAELNTPEILEHVKSKIDSDRRTNQPIFSFSLYATNYMRGEPIQYPAFFSIKSDNKEPFEKENPHINKLYQEGGYIFYFRPAVPQNK